MIGKYKLGDGCAWCGDKPATPILIASKRSQGIAYKIESLACDRCKRRLEEGNKDD